jgi:hypothetical protein
VNPTENLKRELLKLRRLVDAQRLVRYGLRATWLFGAGFLAGWAIQSLSGVLPDARLWLLIGLLPAAASLAPLFWKRPSLSGFVWHLDRRLSLKEQLSTASSTPAAAANPVATLLQQEALGLVPSLQKRILRGGWRISGELLSLGVVLALGLGIYFGVAPPPEAPVSLAPGDRLSLPSFQPQEATLQQVLPQGVLSLNPDAKPPDSQQAAGSASGDQSSSKPGQQPGSSSGDQPGSGQQPGSSNSMEALSQALQQAGQALSQQSSSYELGQALQNQDLAKAADQLEQLADKLGSLSQQSRDQLAKSLGQAAGALSPQNTATSPPQNTATSPPQDQSTQKLAQDLNQAAQSLQAPDQSSSQPGQSPLQPSAAGSPRDAMDAIAGDLRDLATAAQQAQQASAGGGAGLGGGGPKFGPPETLARLQGESGDFKLDVNDPSLAGILTPGQPIAGNTATSTTAGSTVAAGAADAAGAPGDTASRGVLFPYSYPYHWQAVIAQYFQRGN